MILMIGLMQTVFMKSNRLLPTGTCIYVVELRLLTVSTAQHSAISASNTVLDDSIEDYGSKGPIKLLTEKITEETAFRASSQFREMRYSQDWALYGLQYCKLVVAFRLWEKDGQYHFGRMNTPGLPRRAVRPLYEQNRWYISNALYQFFPGGRYKGWMCHPLVGVYH